MVTSTIMQILGQRPFGFGYFLIAEDVGKVLKETLSNYITRHSDTVKTYGIILFVMTDR